MITLVIDEGRELTHEECVKIAKERGIEVVTGRLRPPQKFPEILVAISFYM